jgi:hypothetical protein
MKSTLTVLLLIASTVLTAQTPPSKQIVIGAGGEGCAEWTAVRKSPERSDEDFIRGLTMVSWVQGFLYGSARTTALRPLPADPKTTATGGSFDPPEPAAITDWLDTYCAKLPEQPIELAAIELVKELEKKTAPRPAPKR